MDTKKILQDIGLTQNESRCYNALLKHGSLTIQELSGKTGIHRVNLYSVIRGLESKGAVSFEVKGRYRKKIVPNSPRQLLELVSQEQRTLKKAELKLRESLPSLVGLLKQGQERVSIRYFEGLDGVKQVIQDVFTATTEIKGFSNVDILTDYIPGPTMDELRKQKSELGLTGSFIFPDSKKSRMYVRDEYKQKGLEHYPAVRVMRTPMFQVLAEMDVYDEKVAIISLSKQEQMGLIIQSKIVATSFESVFDTLWQIAEPV